MRQYVRKCNCCDYKLVTSSETKDKTSKSYIYRKCPKCRSEAFDYGSWQGFDTKPWRDKWMAITGRELTTPESELDNLIYEHDGYLAIEDSELYTALIKAGY